MEKYLTKRSTIIIVGLITLWRAYLSATLQLHPDEAYYWLWARRLALGYFDHSPMVGYFIKLTTLFSQAEFWVRFSSIITTVVVSICTWRLALQMFGSVTAASASVLLLNTYPLTMSGSLIITPDIPVFLFCSLATYYFWQVVATQQVKYWYVFGLMFGLAQLSKYTAVLMLPGLLLFLLMTDERKWLKSIHPYLSVLLGFACFLPVVYWNSRHEWISFTFQLGHGLVGQQRSIGRVAEYVGSQLLVAGPFVFLFGAWAAAAFCFRKRKAELFLALSTLPIILFFAYTSLKKLAGANWPATVYFTFAIAAAAWHVEGGKFRRLLLGGALAVNIILNTVVMLYARYSIVPLPQINTEWARADATNWFYGWREMGEEILARYPDVDFVMTPSHQVSAEVIYYTHEKVFAQIDPKVTRASQFNIWPFPEDYAGKTGLYLYVEDTQFGKYSGYFDSTDAPSSLSILRQGFPIRIYHMIRGRGYRYQKFS